MMDKKLKKINKLCKETSMKIRSCEGEINMHLIDFANRYRELWEQ